MKVVVAIDSLKGSLSSLEANDVIRAGTLRTDSSAEVLVRPLADGGEGTVEALTMSMDGILREARVTGPLGAPVTAVCDILQDGRTAILEMAAAVGITLVEEKERNLLNTTTYRAGEVIRDTIPKGCRHFIVGIGDSMTNDGDIGMLQTLGYGLLDSEGKQVPFGAKGLQVLGRISDERVMPELADCTFRVACDVINTLCGNQGCSAVFDPRRGADLGMIMQTDKWLAYYAALMRGRYEKANPWQVGTDAAGGLGFVFLTFTDTQLESGIKIVLEETRPKNYVKEADLVITGERRLDGQIVMDKVPVGVAHIAKQYGKSVITFAGAAAQGTTAYGAHGVDALFPILCHISTLQEAMESENVGQDMADMIEQALHLFLLK